MTARMSRRRTRRQLSAQAVVLWVALLAVSCSDGDSSRQATEGSPEPAEAARYGATGGGQGYTEEEIGLDYLVNEYIAGDHILARYRTYEDHREASSAAGDFRSLSVEERDRVIFEQAVQLLLLAADEALPPEVEAASDEMWHAFYRSLDLCVERSEWPEAKLYEVVSDGYISGSYEVFEAAQQLYGMTLDEFIDFEHECHKFAATYPALDREYRDELLERRRGFYLERLRSRLRDNPEMVVPMTYEQGVNHPYQDYVREICQTTEDPQECARQEGVSFE